MTTLALFVAFLLGVFAGVWSAWHRVQHWRRKSDDWMNRAVEAQGIAARAKPMYKIKDANVAALIESQVRHHVRHGVKPATLDQLLGPTVSDPTEEHNG